MPSQTKTGLMLAISKSHFVYHGLKAVVCFRAFGCSRC